MSTIPERKPPVRGNEGGPKPAPLRFVPPELPEPYWPDAAGDGLQRPDQHEGSPWDAVTIVQQIRGLLSDYFDGWGYSAERDEKYQTLTSQLLAILNGPPFVDVIAATIRASAPPAPAPNLTKTVGTVDYVVGLLPTALGMMNPNDDADWWDHVGMQGLDILCSWLILTLRRTHVPRPKRSAIDLAQAIPASRAGGDGATLTFPKPPLGSGQASKATLRTEEPAAAPNGGVVAARASEKNPSDRAAQAAAARRREMARRLHANGMPNKSIADKLNVSVRTVYNYLSDPHM